jgi:molybdopterin synthase sulfur carrier subunit
MSDTSIAREITIRYFAWVREKTGRGEERIVLPANIVTVRDLITWQKGRGPEFAAAFARPDAIRSALDRVHVKADAAIGTAQEIGFFPPVTGG